jgi:hypothetical protein
MPARALTCSILAIVALLTGCSGGAGGADAGMGLSRDADQAGDGDGGSGGGSRPARSLTGVAADSMAARSGYSAEEPGASVEVNEAEAARPQAQVLPQTDRGIGPSVIKTATIRLAIKDDDFTRAVQEATSVAERYGGYVVSTAVDDRGSGFATATLRVPADKFGSALGAVRGVGQVQREEIAGEDVTQELVDLEARLRHLKSQEAVLLRLMNDARSVLETIRVQEHLSGVQLEIERLRGRLRYLDDQVSFSTIFVEMRQTGAVGAPRAGVLGRAWQRAVDGALSVVGGTIVAVGFALPLIVMLLLSALALRMVWPRLRRANAG